MRYDFVKMQGCGNDYVYFDCRQKPFPEPEKNAVLIADRHFGVGGDGIILICPSDIADARMRIYNADGSEGKMCGNGSRCVARYLFERGGIQRSVITLETGSGVKTLHINQTEGAPLSVTVEMGAACFAPAHVPVLTEKAELVDEPLCFGGAEYRVTCLSMGNPHCVVFVPDPAALRLDDMGPAFESSPLFPESVNTEFVRVLSEHELEMRVWERGSGETLACGTGACAAAAAACRNGFCVKGEPVLVHLPGGVLKITCEDSAVLMEGPAEYAFEGRVEIQ